MTETFAQQWLAAMLGVSIQFTVLAAIVAAALYVLRPLPPRIRYVVWLLVLARLAIPVGLTSPWGAVPSSLLPSRIAEAPAGVHAPVLDRVETTAHEGAASAVAARAATRTRPGPTLSPAVVLLVAWGIGVLGLLTVQAARSARRRARLRTVMEPLPPEVERRIDELRSRLGLRRAVNARVVTDEAVDGPLVQGCVRPRILLPASLVRSWSRKELDAVLLHELIHLRRLDPAARAFGNLLQIVYFFHPVVWWVRRRLAEEREKACDDAVVRLLPGDKRIYMKSLLRLAEERAGAWGGMQPELRMAAERRPLARRLKRMLRPHYNPSRRVGALAIAGLALGVGLGCALSTGAPLRPPTQEAQVEEPPEIYTRVTRTGAYFAESIDQIEEADRVEVGRDFAIGRRLATLKPDAAALATRNPALFERLEELKGLSVTFLVDRAGAVHDVRFLRNIDADLRRPFLEALDAARFAPTIHAERGPAIVEVTIDYYINQHLPRRSLYERGQAFAGDEVAEVFALSGPLALGGPLALPPEGPPLYPLFVTVLQKGNPPVLDVSDEEWILSFTLSLNARGNVESAMLFRDSRAGPWEETHESTPASERLAAYIETFRFEPIVLSGSTPEQALAMIDLRVSARGVEVATRAGEDLERRLAEAYRLPDGRNLDLRLPPHPPERTVLYRAGHAVQARAVPWGPDSMTIVWTDDRPALDRALFSSQGTHLLALMQSLGLQRRAVRFERGAQSVPISNADIVRRDGASEEALINDLADVLRERLDVGLDFEVASEPAPTLVLRGSIGDVPRDDEQDGARVLHVFTDGRNEDPRRGAGIKVWHLATLVAILERHLDMPVADETLGTVEEPFRVRLHDESPLTQRLDLLIENLEAQTDLEIAVEERVHRVVVVSPS